MRLRRRSPTELSVWSPAASPRRPRQPRIRKHETANVATPAGGMMIKPWVFEFFPELGGEARDPDPQELAAYTARYLDLWVRDEALGFEGIFFSEHHFGGSFSASPNLL